MDLHNNRMGRSGMTADDLMEQGYLMTIKPIDKG